MSIPIALSNGIVYVRDTHVPLTALGRLILDGFDAKDLPELFPQYEPLVWGNAIAYYQKHHGVLKPRLSADGQHRTVQELTGRILKDASEWQMTQWESERRCSVILAAMSGKKQRFSWWTK